jgi:hypothetical protein
MGANPTIVKVQRAIMPPDKVELLIYARGHHHMQEQIVPPTVRNAMGDDLKAYFKASWFVDKWVIHKRVADQDW